MPCASKIATGKRRRCCCRRCHCRCRSRRIRRAACCCHHRHGCPGKVGLPQLGHGRWEGAVRRTRLPILISTFPFCRRHHHHHHYYYYFCYCLQYASVCRQIVWMHRLYRRRHRRHCRRRRHGAENGSAKWSRYCYQISHLNYWRDGGVTPTKSKPRILRPSHSLQAFSAMPSCPCPACPTPSPSPAV